MKNKFFILILLFTILLPSLCMAQEYALRQSNMREVSPMEIKAACDTDSTETYYVSSAPLTDRDFTTIVYDYPDSMIISDYGFLTTFKKFGKDTLALSSVENRVLRLSPKWELSTVFVRGLTIPTHLDFPAYAEQTGKDTMEVRIEAGVIPGAASTATWAPVRPCSPTSTATRSWTSPPGWRATTTPRAYFTAIPRFDRPDALTGKYQILSHRRVQSQHGINKVQEQTITEYELDSPKPDKHENNLSFIRGTVSVVCPLWQG